MENRQFDPAESLALIGRMIENTRNHMVRNAGRPMLIWGYTTILTTLVVCTAAYYFRDPRWNYLWFLLPLAGWLLMYLTRTERSEGHVKTFIDRVIGQVWLVTGLTAVFISALSIFDLIAPPILFTLLLMMGVGTTITGLVIRFTPATVGGFAAIVLAPLSFASECWMWQPLLFIVGFLVMMVIPGHILNYRSNRQQQ